ncbi:hypothetical protein FH972_009354 [Carpinus fangiana]|uniref:NAD(P)-binding domain-containing protein n=1 Tax=Carpinus fangiana TaxID=176857 RepID=A0A5N6R3V2_9ROSI|nr:hypothetical protein FH972_009354 [Carpinus fangiana]
MASPPDTSKTIKLERYNSYLLRVNSTKLLNASSKILFRATLLIALALIFYFTFNYPPLSDNPHHVHAHHNFLSSALYGPRSGGTAWEKQVRHSFTPHRPNGMSMLVTGAGGFIGSHCSLALKKRGDDVLGLDNFNEYYDPSLKRARQALLLKHQVFIVEGDLNDDPLLKKLFNVVPFTHILHLAAQAGVQYAMQNPQSYVSSNIAGFVNLLEVAKAVNPQPTIIWASFSSVYGLNTENPFSELHRTDQSASLYAATKKAGEEITHTYKHVIKMPWNDVNSVSQTLNRAMLTSCVYGKDLSKGLVNASKQSRWRETTAK